MKIIIIIIDYRCLLCPQNTRRRPVVSDRKDNVKRHVVQMHKNMTRHGCQMAIAGFLESYAFGPSGF